MEKTISELLASYEAKAVSRRQLVAALALLVAPSAKLAAAPLPRGALEHLSLQVRDVERSTRFYRDALGLTVATGERPDGSVRLDFANGSFLVIRQVAPAGKIDHFCIRLDNFNKEAVTQQLTAQGIQPIDEQGGAGFHVVDPDGVNVQFQ
jgi:catechol 2,3-dioxygenase-like lactoylglutathione lyase family enzyme